MPALEGNVGRPGEWDKSKPKPHPEAATGRDHHPTLLERISGAVPGTSQDPGHPTFWERVGGAAPFSLLGGAIGLIATPHRASSLLSAALAVAATGPLGVLLSVIGLSAYAMFVVPMLAVAAALAAFFLVLTAAPPKLLRDVFHAMADMSPVADRIKITSLHALNGKVAPPPSFGRSTLVLCAFLQPCTTPSHWQPRLGSC